uniref:FGENESH: predicted gene_12.27 protein n=1 Tax=Rhodotorula toruloides TaxID=5286 RepID=A0A0K3CS51_RHOTO
MSQATLFRAPTLHGGAAYGGKILALDSLCFPLDSPAVCSSSNHPSQLPKI